MLHNRGWFTRQAQHWVIIFLIAGANLEFSVKGSADPRSANVDSSAEISSTGPDAGYITAQTKASDKTEA